MPRADGQSETLEIPQRMRVEVGERDGGYCRLCGEFVGDVGVLHHIRYGMAMGARRKHYPENLITLGQFNFKRDCHSVVHSHKQLWLPYLIQAIQSPGVTALQLRRWDERGRANRR